MTMFFRSTPRKSLTLSSLRDTDGDRRSVSKCKLHVSGPIKRLLCTSLIHKKHCKEPPISTTPTINITTIATASFSALFFFPGSFTSLTALLLQCALYWRKALTG
ncbi:hypothetical protein NEUTE2DRAFT_138825 [Neurospora tetrasperma FGSC 2509]|nr:hypothetical protein NEUTE2DRAFT_138825 [Neurospora tetrasperma FGSC 2509]